MDDIFHSEQLETVPLVDPEQVFLTDALVISALGGQLFPVNWESYPKVLFHGISSGSPYYTDLDAVTFLKSEVQNSLDARNTRLGQFFNASPDFNFDHCGIASFGSGALEDCSFANPFLMQSIDPFIADANEVFLSPPTFSAIAHLSGDLILDLLHSLRSGIRFLTKILRFLTSLVSLLIRRSGRPTFEHTFLGVQKAFHLCHGAHPPRHLFGLSSGRGRILFGGCCSAPSFDTV